MTWGNPKNDSIAISYKTVVSSGKEFGKDVVFNAVIKVCLLFTFMRCMIANDERMSLWTQMIDSQHIRTCVVTQLFLIYKFSQSCYCFGLNIVIYVVA